MNRLAVTCIAMAVIGAVLYLAWLNVSRTARKLGTAVATVQISHGGQICRLRAGTADPFREVPCGATGAYLRDTLHVPGGSPVLLVVAGAAEPAVIEVATTQLQASGYSRAGVLRLAITPGDGHER